MAAGNTQLKQNSSLSKHDYIHEPKYPHSTQPNLAPAPASLSYTISARIERTIQQTLLTKDSLSIF